MARPTSFRLPEELLARLEAEGRASEASVTALVASILDEGLKTRRFPGVVYRDGVAGRRAALVGGPDIWEVVRDLRSAPGRGLKRIENLAAEIDVPVSQVRAAADFYVEHPKEIDHLIALDKAAAQRAKRLIKSRERLLSA